MTAMRFPYVLGTSKSPAFGKGLSISSRLNHIAYDPVVAFTSLLVQSLNFDQKGASSQGLLRS